MQIAYKTMVELIKQNVHEIDVTAQVWLKDIGDGVKETVEWFKLYYKN